jgi:hypothetical protein
VKPEPMNRLYDLISFPGKIASYDNFLRDRFIYVEGSEYKEIEEKLISLRDPAIDFEEAEKYQLVIVDSSRSLQYKIRERFVDK